MSVLGWVATGSRQLLATLRRQRAAGRPVSRSLSPRLESLETIELLSHAGLALRPAAIQEFRTLTPSLVQIHAAQTASPTETSQLQTATVPSTMTNFTQAFAPPISLFNANLGTLTSVQITYNASLTSQITSENTSTTSPADITGSTTGTFSIAGLGVTPINENLTGTTTTVTVPAFAGGPINFTGPSTVVFPPLTSTASQSLTLTDAADLAYFTTHNGLTTVTPTLTANATSGASAPNGNLQTLVATSGQGQISVSYTYTPATPQVVSLVRYGIHHQATQLQVTFQNPIDPTQAATPSYYTVLTPNRFGQFTGPGVAMIPITSAVYDATTNAVTLTPARRLNFHKLFQLQIKLPANNGNTIVIEFGGPKSVAGFHDPRTGAFVPVNNGRIPARYLR